LFVAISSDFGFSDLFTDMGSKAYAAGCCNKIFAL